MTIIIFDFEIFAFDTLLGCIVVENNKQTLVQLWDEDEIREFYEQHKNDLWVGHNNWAYDDIILDAIVNNKSAKKANDKIIKQNIRMRSDILKHSYDLMATVLTSYSLKLTELLTGKNIQETEVDFDLDRPLTQEEKILTENYNKADLEQTLYNFNIMQDRLKLRLDMIKEFNLDLDSSLKLTGTQLAAKILKVKKDESLKNKPIKPSIYSTLQLENERLKEFYLNEEFKQEKHNDIITVGQTTDIHIGAGGMHQAIPKYHTKKCLLVDVSGYYNLIMINYDLLPRTMSDESKKLYEYMYHEQLRLKKINPVKRNIYKTVLLAVFGAMLNEYCDFYDPYKGALVTITGQLFMIDLIEKLGDLVKVIQINTDGIMIEPYDWNNYDKVISIIEEWEARTGFTCKKDMAYDLYQRDVNNYMFVEEDNSIHYKGEALKNYIVDNRQFSTTEIFHCKEPPIIAQGIISYLIHNIPAEEYVERHKDDLKLFQYACKKNSFDYLEYEETEIFQQPKITRLQNLNRAFAMKDPTKFGMIYKHKIENGKDKKAKVSNLPPSVFVYNNEILSEKAIKEIQEKIDYRYYINRIYERVDEFLPTEVDTK